MEGPLGLIVVGLGVKGPFWVKVFQVTQTHSHKMFTCCCFESCATVIPYFMMVPLSLDFQEAPS